MNKYISFINVVILPLLFIIIINTFTVKYFSSNISWSVFTIFIFYL